ncbi:MAG: hypothetical protein KAG92_05890, partial [Deltaproteobacteria bacterium]|nr:hypothetical protein [Deltaproteobacteria bacterium]
CTTFGHKNVARDRFDYNEAIKQSHNQQMLLNLVRLRYLVMPDFLTVSSIITSYNYEGSLGLSGTVSGHPFSHSATGDGNIHYAERPTITYTPMAGQEFAQLLLRPMSVDGLFALGHAGWPMDILMTIGLQHINNARNMGPTLVPSPGEVNMDEQHIEEVKNLNKFSKILKLMLILTEKGVLEVQQSKGKDKTVSLHFSKSQNSATQQQIAEFKSILNLDSKIDVFRIVNRAINRQPDEISIQSRSLLSMMTFLSKGVEVPEEDGKTGKALLLPEEVQRAIAAHGVLTIHSQKDLPVDPFVAVKYRDNWFYIDITDLTSKRTFSTLQILFQLQSPSNGAAAPLLTLPAG